MLVISTSLDLQIEIEDLVSHHRFEKLFIQTSASFGQDRVFWETAGLQVVVLDLPDDVPMLVAFLKKMKTELPRQLPVVAVTPVVSDDFVGIGHHFDRIRVLKKPVTPLYLYRTIIDLTTDYGLGKKQVHPRYMTDQSVILACDYKNGAIRGVMKNVSLGGAYVESKDKSLELVPGDLLKMHVEVPEQKNYSLDVKVIWKKPVAENQSVGYGLTFITLDQAFDRLFRTIE